MSEAVSDIAARLASNHPAVDDVGVGLAGKDIATDCHTHYESNNPKTLNHGCLPELAFAFPAHAGH